MPDKLTPDSPPELLRAAAERNRNQLAALQVANLAHGRLLDWCEAAAHCAFGANGG